MKDRRIFNRIEVLFDLSFVDLTKGVRGKAQAINISANGIGFITAKKVSPKAPLEIWLVIPDHHEPFYTKGEVVWSEALAGTDKQRVGVKLEKENFMGLARALWVKQQEADKSL